MQDKNIVSEALHNYKNAEYEHSQSLPELGHRYKYWKIKMGKEILKCNGVHQAISFAQEISKPAF